MNRNNQSHIALGGEWVITVINQQLQCLMGHRSSIGESSREPKHGSEPADARTMTIDLNGVESLDASGCQLLSSFVKVMEKEGVKSEFAPMPASFQELFESLGYQSYLAPDKP